MRTGLLLLAVGFCVLWTAEAQNGGAPQRPRSVWEDPVTFVTKAKDSCAMHVTGQGEFTTLRVVCQGPARSYWCDYRGKPQACRTYNNNPRHYFTQIMWDLRKLENACRGPVTFKPQMCKKASEEARMVFIGASADTVAETTPEQDSRPSRPTQTRPNATRPVRPQPNRPTRPQPARPTNPDRAKVQDQERPVMPRPGSRVNKNSNNNDQRQQQPSTSNASPTQSLDARKMAARRTAQDYCWRSMTGICAYMIGLLRN